MGSPIRRIELAGIRQIFAEQLKECVLRIEAVHVGGGHHLLEEVLMKLFKGYRH
jgi:hypothetical protein